jgi:hypothetical protein
MKTLQVLRGLTIAVGNRRNRILLYQFLAAEIRALHCSYGVGDGESYKRALTFLENCERFTLRSIAQIAAYLAETRNSRLASNCVVVDAVCFEPISASKLPDNRENTGNFAEVGLILRKLAR